MMNAKIVIVTKLSVLQFIYFWPVVETFKLAVEMHNRQGDLHRISSFFLTLQRKNTLP